jgi:GNAT superfamily N-acetyltransferase
MPDAPTPQLRFGADYRERVRLADGREALLRLVIPADKLLLKRGMDAFSPESRFHRFLGTKPALSDDELRYLTEVDGVDHFAIGATLAGPAGAEEGIGVARFVRFYDDPEVAEPTVAVLDAYQHLGLGSLLFARLADAARERGVRRFSGRMLTHNDAMRRLLRRLAPDILWTAHGYVSEFDWEL